MTLKIDPSRKGEKLTGIYVRAEVDGKFAAYDIYELDKTSLIEWLRSREGKNAWMESVVLHLLYHDSES